MDLQTLINFLAWHPPTLRFAVGLCNPHSYRGYYECLAFEPLQPEQAGQACRIGGMTAGEILDMARNCNGSMYGGWKGGTYFMGLDSKVYIAEEGCTGDLLSPEFFVLASPPAPTNPTT